MLLVMKKELQNKTLVLIALFLTLELILFIALDFGRLGTVFNMFAFVLVALLAPFFFKAMKVDLAKGLYILLMPILFYSFVTLLAPAYGTMDVVYNNETLMNYSFLDKAATLFGAISILLLGYLLRKSKVFLPKHVYIVILAGLTAPILISLFATLINYGFFHTIIYQGKVNFYGGSSYLITKQASYLYGFKIMTIDINVLLSGALIIASAGLGLLLAKKELHKFELISLSLISAIGVLTIILTGSFLTLLFLLPAIIFALIVRFNLFRYFKNKITLYIVIGLLALGSLIFVLNAFNVSNINNIWASNKVTRKLFLNGYMLRFYYVFREAFTFRNILGDFRNTIGIDNIFPTGNFLFDAMWIDGLLGFLFLAAFLIIFGINLVKYYINDNDDKVLKVMLVSVLLTMFFRFMLFNPFHQYLYKEFQGANHFPLNRSPYFLVVLFLAGYTFFVKEEVEVSHEEN